MIAGSSRSGRAPKQKWGCEAPPSAVFFVHLTSTKVLCGTIVAVQHPTISRTRPSLKQQTPLRAVETFYRPKTVIDSFFVPSVCPKALTLVRCKMDRFYLENAALYQKLVDSFDAAAPVPHFSRFKATASSRQEVEVEEQRDPNMIVSARIRPMLDDDLDAGFPCAAFPRSSKLEEPQVVDIHDLYNHPRGRPLLKVRFKVELPSSTLSTPYSC